MNIMLTEIRSLTLDMQEIPVVEQGHGDSFTQVLQQQLPTDAENLDQVIEFKDFLKGSSKSHQSLGMDLVTPSSASWQDYLSQQKIHITTDADPVEAIPVDLGSNPSIQSQTSNPARPEIVPGSGELLPAGGNALPDEAFLNPQAQPQEVDSRGHRQDAPPAVTPLSFEARDSGIATTIQRISLDTAARPNAGMPVNAAVIADPPVVAQTESTKPLDDRLPGGNRIAPDSQLTDEERLDNRIDKPLPLAREAIVRAQASDQQPIAVGLRETRADALSPGSNRAGEIGVRDAILAREMGFAGLNPSREMPPVPPSVPKWETTAGVEPPIANEIRDQTRFTLQPLKTQPEAGPPDFMPGRVAETSQQVVPAQTQSNIAPLSAGVAGSATIATAAMPAVNASLLPPQLETMSLARGADSAEWGNGLGDRISWMINQKQNSATIRIDPPMLGKLDVQVKIADDATTITIQTHHAQTRDLIESASVRLRDFLQENGYQNVSVDVSQRQDQQQGRTRSDAEEQISHGDEADPAQQSNLAQHQLPRYFSGDGILDTFA